VEHELTISYTTYRVMRNIYHSTDSHSHLILGAAKRQKGH